MRGIVKQSAAPGVRFRNDLPEPKAGPGNVVLEVAATSVCGTDIHLYEWSASAQAFNPTLPIVMGHECAGTVVAVGSGSSSVKIGDRVAVESHIFCGACYYCRTGAGHNCANMKLLGITWPGAFAEYLEIPERVCFPLPPSVPLEVGALFEPCGVAVHALQRAGGSVEGSSVLVCGCGPIGLVLIQLCRSGGATRVIGVEPNPYRRRMAESLGAVVLDPRAVDVAAECRSLEPRHGGVDVAFECSAVERMIPVLLESVRRESTIVIVGHPNAAVPVDLAAYVSKKGVTLTGVFGRRIWDTWEMLLALVDAGRLDIASLITHRIALNEFDHGIELLHGESAKVLVVPR